MSRSLGPATGGIGLLVVCLAGCGTHSQDLSPIVLGRGYADTAKSRLVDHSAFSDRVLIIRDPDALEDLGYDPNPVEGSLDHVASFRSLMEKAGAKHFNADNIDWYLPSFIDCLTNLWHPCADQTRCLDTAPLRLLAVAFRPDLANFLCDRATEGSDACGAEMHFEFGLTDNTGASQFAIIVEFAVPRQSKVDFQEMVNGWSALSDIANPHDLATAFVRKWSAYGGQFSSSRIRLSAKRDTGWDVRQYGFDSTGLLKIADRLPDEIDQYQWIQACSLSKTALGFLASGAPLDKIPNALLKLANTARFDTTQLEIGKLYSSDVRFALALNSCSGCHSLKETGTPVLQISPRKHHEKSELSSFLTGISPAAYGEPTTGYYSVPDPGTCGQDHPLRSFNDLLRREFYIDAVRLFKTSDTDWTTKLTNQHLLIRSVE